jgi:hypothetical protein
VLPTARKRCEHQRHGVVRGAAIKDRGPRAGRGLKSSLSDDHPAELCRANVFEYLVALMRNADRVVNRPEHWMPWNYTEALAAPSSVATAAQ